MLGLRPLKRSAAKRPDNDNLIERVSKLVPNDGDVIVLTAKGYMLPDERVALSNQLSDFLELIGKDVKVLILENDMQISLLDTSRLKDREAA